jgi:hypothetical protein
VGAKISILFLIGIMASVLPVYGGPLLAHWSIEDQAGGIAVGLGGEVYVTINNSHKVVKYSPEGEKLAEWDVDGVIETNGIAVGPGGEVYVTINNSHKVVKYSPEGEKLDEWTVDGVMNGIAVGPNGFVYISFTNRMIQVFGA